MEYILDEASDSDTESVQELLVPPEEHRLPSTTKSVRWSGKRFLLTYSQFLEDPDDVFNHIDRKKRIKQAVGAIERHQDGGYHLHIALEFEAKLNTINCHYFDYQYAPGYDSFHPNVSPSRSWGACVNYCRGQDKDVMQKLEWQCTFNEAVESAQQKKPDLYEVARSMENKEKFVQWCFENSVNGLFMREVWSDICRPLCLQTFDTASDAGPSGRPAPPSFDERFRYLKLPDPYDKPVVVLGPTGSGKTIWAVSQMFKRFGRGLMVNHVDQLKNLVLTGPAETRHNCVVFDEIRFSGNVRDGKGRWPDTSQIAVCDTEFARSIHARYSNAVLPAGFPRLFTAAVKLPFNHLDGQIARRVHIINLYDAHVDDLWPE